MKNKGFTLTEVLVALLLVTMLMLATFAIISFASQSAVQSKIEASIHSVCIASIEETRNALETTHILAEDTENIEGELGSIRYTLNRSIEQLQYPGAYRLSLHIRTNTGYTFAKEVILYE